MIIRQNNKQQSIKHWDQAIKAFKSIDDKFGIADTYIFKSELFLKEKKYNEAINNAKVNGINYFIIFDIDRFSRWWFWVYDELKENLAASNIELRDSKNIIQQSKWVMENELIDMDQYAWNIETPSVYTEMMMTTHAQIDWKRILQKTITREVQLCQLGYQTRQPNFWYSNKKVRLDQWKATIQVRHPIEWEWIEQIFTMRADWNYADEEIVDILNAKWYKSRRWNKLSIMQLQLHISRLIYAWVMLEKWTWNKPIRAAYDGLIDIKTWNKANRWKVRVIDLGNNEIKVEYNVKNTIRVNKPIIKNRKTYNPYYCFAKVLKCPLCWWNLTGSNSTGGNWKIHYYYFCSWKWKDIKHKTYSEKRNDVHHNLKRVFRSIKIDNSVLKLYDSIIESVYNERTEEISINKVSYSNNLRELYTKEKNIIRDIDKVIDYPLLLKAKNTELEDLKKEIISVLWKKDEDENIMTLEKFKHYCKTIFKHLDKLIEQTDRPDLIALIFDIVFGWRIEYWKIISQTDENSSATSILKQKKISNNENFPLNMLWHLHLESN